MPDLRAFHERLVTEDVFEKLEIDLVMFPLDSECNWMLDTPLHPGACVVSKAVICGEDGRSTCSSGLTTTRRRWPPQPRRRPAWNGCST